MTIAKGLAAFDFRRAILPDGLPDNSSTSKPLSFFSRPPDCFCAEIASHLLKIYTKTGDEGTTGLFAGPRVAKDDVRIEAYGTVDELNASLGVARSQVQPAEIDRLLGQIQNDLFAVGAELATPDPVKHGTHWIGESHIKGLESAIDRYDAKLPQLQTFVLPAGTAAATSLHLARAICRRAERRTVTLGNTETESVSADLIIYLNRLGDLLFVLSRWVTAEAGQVDVPWVKPKRDEKLAP